jgi:SAM-dependent methyltransferase
MPAQHDIHQIAAAGFQAGSGAYERGRPGYPVEAVEFLIDSLGICTGSTVVELGAGTGKFTRMLLSLTKARIIAIEPVENMRRRMEDLLPAITVMDGVAEAIPVGEATADVVLSAQAFHWFDGRRALTEITRVLKPGGGLGLVWNARDESTEWVACMTEIIDRHGAGVPQYKSMEWKLAFDQCPCFAPLAKRSFRHVQTGDLQMLLDRVASISFIAALPPSDRQAVLAEVTQLVRTHPQTRALPQITLPYRTDVYWASKTG